MLGIQSKITNSAKKEQNYTQSKGESKQEQIQAVKLTVKNIKKGL